MNQQTAIEFFAGIGLVHEALKPFGWEVILANDNCPKKVRAYRANFPQTTIAEIDVRDLDTSGIGNIRLATASFPCVDLSQAGYREGIYGERSSVVWSFLDHIAALKQRGEAPEFLLIENVPGLLSLHEGRSIDALLHRIAEMDYSFDLIQVDACHFLPQTRNRVFIIAVMGRDRFARPFHIPDTYVRRYKVKETYLRNPNLPWVFFDLPGLPVRHLQLEDIVEILLPEDQRWWEESRMAYFWASLEKHHRPMLEALMASSGVKYLTATRRLRRRGIREQIINVRFDGVASCLRTPGGGSSTQLIIEIRQHCVQVRMMLGAEAARLQGVRLPGQSENFVLPDSETEMRQGFGDAVCVPVVRWVFSNTIERLAAGERRHIDQQRHTLQLALI